MAFGGRELRLFLSIQSYGTSNLARLRQDISRLQSTVDIANAKQLASARAAQRALRVSAAEQELRHVRAGIPAYEARTKAVNAWGRANASVQSTLARQMSNQRQLFDIETKRMVLNQKLLTAKAKIAPAPQIAILERGLQSLTLQEGVLNQNAKALNATLATQRSVLHQADRAYKALVRDTQALGVATRKAAADLEVAAAAANQAAAAVRRLEAAERALPLQQMEHAARGLAHVGRAAQFAGLITTATFGVAANTFADFSERASLAATQMRDIGAPIAQTALRAKELQDRILELGMRFPASATEMSEAAYEIFSSMNIVRGGVVNTAKGFQLLEQANKAAVAGGVELEEATDAMIVVLNNFDPQLRNSSQLLNEMFSVVRFGNLRLNDLGAAMNYLAPIAKTVGLEFADVGAAFATLTILTKNTETASTGLARAIELFRLPVVQKGLERWGVSITDVNNRLLPLNEIMGRLIKRFPGLATGQQSAIEALIQITKASEQTKVGIQGTVQARRAIASLATSMDLYNNILGNVTGNQKEFNLAFAARMADPGVQWQIFLRQMQTLIIVIGREALPVFLALGQRLAGFAQWFKDLHPAVRRTIVQFTAIAGIVALFGGTLLNVTGSLYAHRASMILVGMATEGATKKYIALRIAMGTVALLGLFALIEQMYDFQTAIIVTATAWLFWKTKALQSIAAVVLAARLGAAAVATAFKAALLSTGLGAVAVAAGLAAQYVMENWDQVRAFFQGLAASIAVIWHNLWELVKAEAALAAAETRKWFEKLPPVLGVKMRVPFMEDPDDQIADAQAKVDRLHNEIGNAFTQTYDKAMDAYAKARKAKDKKQAKGFMAEYNKLLKDLVSADFLQAQEDFVNKLNPDTNGLTDAANLAQRRQQEIAQAQENMVQQIDSAVDNLASIYDRFEQENRQAFGSLFQGPVMSGVFGDVFNQINSELRQFGIQIPVPFEILRKDMDMQLDYFKRWRTDLDKLMARGAPIEMIDQIRALGPEAIPLIEGLLGASPKQFRKYVKDFKVGQKLIEQAAKSDMDAQLKDWERHGKNIAWQIISGLASGPAQARLKAGFRQYVVRTFGDILAANMSKEVAAAMAIAMKEAAAAAASQKATDAAAKAAAAKVKPPPVPPRATRAISELTTPEAKRRLAQVNRKLAQLQEGGVRESETALFLELRRRANRLRRRLRALEKQSERELPTIEAPPRAPFQPPRRGSRGPNTNITYEGDRVTIRADGATPATVTRALNKHQFQKKSRNRTNRGQRR